MKKTYLLIATLFSKVAIAGQIGGAGGTSKFRTPESSIFSIEEFKGMFENINRPEGFEINNSRFHVVGVDLSTGRVILQDANGTKIEMPIEGTPTPVE